MRSRLVLWLAATVNLGVSGAVLVAQCNLANGNPVGAIGDRGYIAGGIHYLRYSVDSSATPATAAAIDAAASDWNARLSNTRLIRNDIQPDIAVTTEPADDVHAQAGICGLENAYAPSIGLPDVVILENTMNTFTDSDHENYPAFLGYDANGNEIWTQHTFGQFAQNRIGHEFGHALGLDEVGSNSSSSIMDKGTGYSSCGNQFADFDGNDGPWHISDGDVSNQGSCEKNALLYDQNTYGTSLLNTSASGASWLYGQYTEDCWDLVETDYFFGVNDNGDWIYLSQSEPYVIGTDCSRPPPS
jgi:hypothetical protein